MEINDIVVHKTEGVVKINEVVYMEMNGNKVPYYVFMPYYVLKNANKIMIPETMIEGRIRQLIDEDKAIKIVNSIKNFNLCIWDENNKTRKIEFDKLLLSDSPHELSKLVYLIKRKAKELKGTKKTLSKYDSDTLARAIKVLYGELAYVLNVPLDEIDSYFDKALENA